MARKFSGAARARGFSPISVSNANINRMREENQRILDGMRARQESIRQNDERALQAMKDDAAHISYLKRDINYDNKHGGSNKQMTADEKHISKLAGDMKYDKKHHS